MKRLDQLKDALEELDCEATGEPTLRIEWDFDRHSRFSGSFYSGADTGRRPPTIEFNYPTIERHPDSERPLTELLTAEEFLGAALAHGRAHAPGSIDASTTACSRRPTVGSRSKPSTRTSARASLSTQAHPTSS